jgi:hypothetical protein
VKTSFDLPDRLLRRAKALAARQGRPLRDLVAEAIDRELVVEPGEVTDETGARHDRREAWEAWKARLVREPDGTWRNPEGIDDESFFEALRELRREPSRIRDPFAGAE